MRFCVLSVCAVFLSILTFAYGQDRKDTAYVFFQDRHYAERLVLSPTFQVLDTIRHFGLIQLDQQIDRGPFRMAQHAFDKKVTSFSAIGLNQLGRFGIGGYFEFNNKYEDSLANGQRNDLENLSTFYPFANKSGYYQRQNYLVNASLSYKVTSHWQPFLNLDYHKHWSAGTVDPRLKSDRFTVKFKPGMTTQWTNHALGIYGLFGKADEVVSLTYKNREFRTSAMYPDRMYDMNYGYGSIATKDSSQNYKYDTYKGFGLVYAGAYRGWSLHLSAEYQKLRNTNQTKPRSSTYHHGPVAVFNLGTISANLDARHYTGGDKQQLLSLAVENNEGYDGNLLTVGRLDIVNYRVKEWKAKGQYYFLWHKHTSNAKELGLEMSCYSIKRVDFSQSVDLDIGTMVVALPANWYVSSKGSSRYVMGFKPYYGLPTHTRFTFNPLTVNNFIRHVAFTDYYYYKSRFGGVRANIEYMMHAFGTSGLGIYSTVDYRKAAGLVLREDVNTSFVPSDSRLDLHIGVRLYLNAR